MKYLLAVLAGPILIISLLTGVAGAQSYEGTTAEDGIFFVPDTPTGGENVNLQIAGLAPNAEVIVVLNDSNNDAVDGLTAEVASAIALRADANGDININFALPSDLAPGAYALTSTSTRADGSPFEATWDFVVATASAGDTTGATDGSTAAATGNSSSQTGDALALTGASSRATAFGGGVLVMLGLGLVVIAATSRRRDSVPS